MYFQAVCCSDDVHCCPHGTTCDVSSGKCNRGNTQIDWFEKQPARQLGAVKCSDSQECPDGNTCCKLPGGDYGCCPLPEVSCFVYNYNHDNLAQCVVTENT